MTHVELTRRLCERLAAAGFQAEPYGTWAVLVVLGKAVAPELVDQVVEASSGIPDTMVEHHIVPVLRDGEGPSVGVLIRMTRVRTLVNTHPPPELDIVTDEPGGS